MAHSLAESFHPKMDLVDIERRLGKPNFLSKEVKRFNDITVKNLIYVHLKFSINVFQIWQCPWVGWMRFTIMILFIFQLAFRAGEIIMATVCWRPFESC